jgi:hypothetical protein
MNKYSIQVFYDVEDELKGKFRACTVFQLESSGISEAYETAERAFKGRQGLKFGAIIQGHYLKFP